MPEPVVVRSVPSVAGGIAKVHSIACTREVTTFEARWFQPRDRSGLRTFRGNKYKSVLPMPAVGGADVARTNATRVETQMKIDDYRSMLRAVEKAIEICDESPGVMDEAHLDICRELRITRTRLRRLIGLSDPAKG